MRYLQKELYEKINCDGDDITIVICLPNGLSTIKR